MRTQLQKPMPMAWTRSGILLALGLMQVGHAVEQRSLRSRRIPVISLPDSLLFPSSDDEQQHGGAHHGQSLLLQSGYHEHQQSTNLLNSLEESASEVVEHARETILGGDATTTTQVPTTTTTLTTMTTVDAATLAKQLKITKDTAQARTLLISMIDRAQIGLMTRISDINLDLDAMELRAKSDLTAVNHSFVVAEGMPNMVSNAEVDVEKIKTNGKTLQGSILPDIVSRSNKNTKLITELLKEKKNLESNLDKSKTLPGAQSRIQDNSHTLGALIPRLEKLERRVTKVEGRLYDGDLKKLVDDTTSKQVIDIVEDVSRGFGRFVANP